MALQWGNLRASLLEQALLKLQLSVNAVFSFLRLSNSYKVFLHLHLQRHSCCLCHLTLVYPHVKAKPKEILRIFLKNNYLPGFEGLRFPYENSCSPVVRSWALPWHTTP